MEISDVAATLDEGIAGWLARNAAQCGAPRSDATATCTILTATRVVCEVAQVCDDWHLTVRVTPHSQADWCVVQASGPVLAVLALGDVVSAVRAFGAACADRRGVLS